MMFRKIAIASGAGFVAAAKAVPGLVVDIVGLGGVAAISYGAWLVYPPAGFITGGAIVVCGAYLISAKSARRGG